LFRSSLTACFGFAAHDFFTEQPVRNASVFLLRMIVHDYGRENVAKILKRLRNAATPDTVLLVVEQVPSFLVSG
jgi:O-methyltransferase domain